MRFSALIAALANQQVVYNVYSNSGTGGPVDYTTIVASTRFLTYSPAALARPSDNTFAVRASNPLTGIEERNTEARVRIVIDGSGADVTRQPSAPQTVAAMPTVSGGALVQWSYNPAGQGGAPTGFKVWVTAGASVNYAAAPSATVPYTAGVVVYSATIAGLTGGTAYAVGVRAYNAVATEGNTTAASSVTAATVGPAQVELATTSTGFQSPSPAQI